jgi:hypothetical protein
MLRRSCLQAFALVAFSLVGFFSPAQILAAGNTPDLPFRGSEDGTLIALLPPNELVVDSTGTATYLGRFTSEEHLFLNPDGTFAGDKVFIAADGDELHLDFQGAFTSPTTVEGVFTFTGGTGRFQDASGTASFQAVTPDGVNLSLAFLGSLHL